MNSSKKNPSNSGCFASLLEKIVCAGNLPTHPCSLEEIKVLERNPNSRKKQVSNNNSSRAVVVVNSRVQSQQVEANPGIVARLMGLDSLPTTTYDSLFRSKSLNSVQFLPNFDPTRATFHRRARTSSRSFHEQGCSLMVKIDESLETNGEKMKEIEVGYRDNLRQKKVVIKENVVISEENERTTIGKKTYQQERYYRGNCTTSSKSKFSNRRKNSRVSENFGNKNINNSREKCAISRRKFVKKDNNTKNGSINNSSKNNKVDQSDVSSRSPVSVLDNRLDFDSPSRQENVNARRSRSNLRKKSSPKINLHDDTPRSENNSKANKNEDDSSNKITSEHKSVNTQSKDAAGSFEDMSKQIYALADDQLCEDLTRHRRKYELFKSYFVEEFCQDFDEDVFEFLLNELTNELVELF